MKILYALFHASSPDEKPFLIWNLVDTSFDLTLDSLAEDTLPTQNSRIPSNEQDEFISESIRVSRGHLGFSRFAFDTDHRAVSI